MNQPDLPPQPMALGVRFVIDSVAEGPAAQLQRPPLRQAIDAAGRTPEPEALAPLLADARLNPAQAARAKALACEWVQGLRQADAAKGQAARVQALMQTYTLSSEEGVALMCLAEALLRIPDAATRDALIRDKIGPGQWQQHLGRSDSLFVNAASWGLVITGKLVATHSERGLAAALLRLVARSGEPVIRGAVDVAMRMLGEQFVMGQTIEAALQRAKATEAQGVRYSYDMLGEAAMTAEDAERYDRAYAQAIAAIGEQAQGQGVAERAGISIKLSALHPRYSRSQKTRVMQELWPRLLRLAERAWQYNIGLNIDAEESERLDLSLDLLEALCRAPSLAGWQGIGFVVQAYQKRAPHVIDFLIDLAQRSGHRLMVRLVKGAYWDSEIKRAQQEGQSDYPVYTRKHHTDVSYLACARRLLAHPEAVYPQFATHNAHTLAAVVQMAQAQLGDFQMGQYEFQCLHGMGEPLYRQVLGGELALPCRIYAPVGTHETLLAYLVRRLLENGANTSFVHQINDASTRIEDLVQDPVARVEREAEESGQSRGQPYPGIANPLHLYGPERVNAPGWDLAHEPTLVQLAAHMQSQVAPWHIEPLLASTVAVPEGAPSPQRQTLCNPADSGDALGTVRWAQAHEVHAAVQAAQDACAHWAAWAVHERAALLDRTADVLLGDAPRLLSTLVREAGKSWPHAVAELREAVDFLRDNAAQLRRLSAPEQEAPLGPVLCISPWNFPLAIFVGQVAAALAAGNTVLAKPAEATPAVAAWAVQAFWQAGLPRAALQLLPGAGADVGMQLVRDARVQGVLFTGSTETARIIASALAERLNAHGQAVPLVAETGGQNCMLVDSSALLEQVTVDVLSSAFEAAGQRCSALRVLCVQDDVADRLRAMLLSALRELRVGAPADLSIDVGPVIDARAQARIEAHIARMQAAGRRVHRLCHATPVHRPAGHFVVPTVIEIESLAELEREVFGPVLHVLRYRREDRDALLAQIEATGYALTLGIHSRIDETIAHVIAHSSAGNVYVNRNMVGAVVGVQPFGGEGLSGTGPKAGGPLYRWRLLARRAPGAVRAALQAAGAQAIAPEPAAQAAWQAFTDWLREQGMTALCAAAQTHERNKPSHWMLELPGPTGERNQYGVWPRASVWAQVGTQAEAMQDRLQQLTALLTLGCRVVWPAAPESMALWQRLPQAVQARIEPQGDVHQSDFSAAWIHAPEPERLALARALSERQGALVPLLALAPGVVDVPLERFVRERSICTNTAAAGGNATLMSLSD